MGDEAFLRQREAWEFVASIEDPVERLLAEIALAMALSHLVSDPDYRENFAAAPFDLLLFVRSVDVFLRRKDVIGKVLAGQITDIRELSPFADD